MSDRTSELPAEDKQAGRALRYLGWTAGRLYFAVQIVWRAILHLIDDGGMTFAGHIAFMTLFSLFPFLIFLTTLAGELGQSLAARDFIHISLEALPREVSEAIRPAIEQVISTRRTGLMTVSIVASLWAVSSGLEALREALNQAPMASPSRARSGSAACRAWLFTIIFSICIITS